MTSNVNVNETVIVILAQFQTQAMVRRIEEVKSHRIMNEVSVRRNKPKYTQLNLIQIIPLLSPTVEMKRRKVEKQQKNDDCTIIIDENPKRERSSKTKEKREKSSWDENDGRKEKRVRSKRAL